MSHIFLYGPPGTGKSTVGKELATLLELPFRDLDVDIVNASGRSIPDLMAGDEVAFRDLETAALLRAVERPPSVIALGGGTLLREANRRCAEELGRVVCLDADAATLLARLSQDDTPRPLLREHPYTQLPDLLAQRREHYRSFPTRIHLSGQVRHDVRQSPAAVAYEIVRHLNRLHVHTPDGGVYDVAVRPNGLEALGSMLRERDLGGPVAVVADDTVARLYAERAVGSLRRAGLETHLTTFPAGERSKTVDTVAALWQAMLEAGLGRTSCVVALGGGVTGDLAGFAASTFMRGIDWVGVPTTLLAMVDSSIGGKTGVDLPDGKNLAGSFHHPRLVLVDPQVLDTLPRRDLCTGMAEVVKHGIIGDPELFSLVERGWEPSRGHLVDVIGRALAVKIRIVEEDPFDQGVRASLNLGHTIGHAVEVASGYTVRHGEAVAIGLVAEALLAEALDVARPGVARQILLALRSLGLPVAIPDDIPHESIIRAMSVDKKKSAGAVRFTLPAAIGDVRTGIEVRDLREALASCSAPHVIERLGVGSSPTVNSPTADRQRRGEPG
jgi:3-dehydroquinate synthase